MAGSAKSMTTYFLPSHVHACQVEGSVILLDLLGDRYFGLGPVEARAVARHIVGWPIAATEKDSTLAAENTPIFSELIARGQLTTDVNRAAPRESWQLSTPSQAVRESMKVTVRASDVLDFIVATVHSSYMLKHWPLHRTVQRIASKQLALIRKPELDSKVAIVRAMRVFSVLRPFVFTARDHCLFDSVAVMNFLHRKGLTAQWVFGVQPAPFAAHSWVQFGELVLNDTPETVLAFTPILVV
jgi:hypothetical protein